MAPRSWHTPQYLSCKSALYMLPQQTRLCTQRALTQDNCFKKVIQCGAQGSEITLVDMFYKSKTVYVPAAPGGSRKLTAAA